jgi:exosortase/archaeosortase family protein
MNKFYDLIIRYLFLLVVAFPNMLLFYWIFSPLTIYPVYFLFSLFFETSLSGTIIFVNEAVFSIVGACIAGSAYYLLLILNLSIPNLSCKEKIKRILLAFSLLLGINILRIFILGLIYLRNVEIFDITHKVFWYGLSTLFIVGIWIFEVKYFKIKEIPIYSDLLFIYRNSSLYKKSKISKSSKKNKNSRNKNSR